MKKIVFILGIFLLLVVSSFAEETIFFKKHPNGNFLIEAVWKDKELNGVITYYDENKNFLEKTDKLNLESVFVGATLDTLKKAYLNDTINIKAEVNRDSAKIFLFDQNETMIMKQNQYFTMRFEDITFYYNNGNIKKYSTSSPKKGTSIVYDENGNLIEESEYSLQGVVQKVYYDTGELKEIYIITPKGTALRTYDKNGNIIDVKYKQ